MPELSDDIKVLKLEDGKYPELSNENFINLHTKDDNTSHYQPWLHITPINDNSGVEIQFSGNYWAGEGEAVIILEDSMKIENISGRTGIIDNDISRFDAGDSGWAKSYYFDARMLEVGDVFDSEFPDEPYKQLVWKEKAATSKIVSDANKYRGGGFFMRFLEYYDDSVVYNKFDLLIKFTNVAIIGFDTVDAEQLYVGDDLFASESSYDVKMFNQCLLDFNFIHFYGNGDVSGFRDINGRVSSNSKYKPYGNDCQDYLIIKPTNSTTPVTLRFMGTENSKDQNHLSFKDSLIINYINGYSAVNSAINIKTAVFIENHLKIPFNDLSHNKFWLENEYSVQITNHNGDDFVIYILDTNDASGHTDIGIDISGGSVSENPIIIFPQKDLSVSYLSTDTTDEANPDKLSTADVLDNFSGTLTIDSSGSDTSDISNYTYNNIEFGVGKFTRTFTHTDASGNTAEDVIQTVALEKDLSHLAPIDKQNAGIAANITSIEYEKLVKRRAKAKAVKNKVKNKVDTAVAAAKAAAVAAGTPEAAVAVTVSAADLGIENSSKVFNVIVPVEVPPGDVVVAIDVTANPNVYIPMEDGEVIAIKIGASYQLVMTYADTSGGRVTLAGSSEFTVGASTGAYLELDILDGNVKHVFTPGAFGIGFFTSGDTIKYTDEASGLDYKITIGSVQSEVSNTPTGNVCFYGDTKVKTDQGCVPFANLTINHSIEGQKIKKIIRMLNSDDNMIFIRKHALAKGVPNKNTYISKNHGVYLPGGGFERIRNLVNGDTIVEHRRKKQLIYNVLMPTYQKMSVNGIICETLNDKDPMVLKYL